MDSTVAVQIKGLGFAVQAAINSAIAFSRSGTLQKDPRRTRLQVNYPNQRSTRFNRLELGAQNATQIVDVAGAKRGPWSGYACRSCP